MKILLFANTDWYLFNFRLSLAKALRDQGHHVVLLSPPGRYGPKLQEMGFEWFPLPMSRRSLNPVRELSLLMWIVRFLRKEKPDLFHGFTIKSAVYGLIAARLAGVSARVGSIAGMGYVFTSQDLLARALKPFVRIAFGLAFGGSGARLIVQNPDDFSLISSAGVVRSNQIFLIPGSGVDCSRFTPALEERRNRPFRVLLPARLLWDKGVGEFAQAAALIRAESPHIKFLIAGDRDPGNPACIPESQIQAWVDQGLITALGHVSDIADLYRSVDLVVLPSYREGLPKGLIEAAACALPLVTTDVPGCREVVTHGVDGLLVPVKDAAALATAIKALSQDPALCIRLGKAARQKALREFDEKIIVQKTLDVYQAALPTFT
jgi:glycosyltransferase involved in cell wall biosynthesis